MKVARRRLSIRVVVVACPAPKLVLNAIIVVIVVKVAIVEDASDSRLGVVREWEDAARGTRRRASQTPVILERPRTNVDIRNGGTGACIISVDLLSLALLTPLVLQCAS
jgi:hypothetical protein